MALAAASLIALVLVAMAARVLAEAGRALQQDGESAPSTVQNAQELQVAIQLQSARIHFRANVTISQDDFPEVSRDCLTDSAEYPDAFEACQPGARIYTPTDTPALWTSDPDAFLDVRFLQRSLLIGQPVTLQGMNVAQMFDDRLPYFFFFATFSQGSLAIVDSTLYSPCGGRDPRYVLETLINVLPPTATYRIDDMAQQLYIADSGRLRLVDSINPGEVLLRNTTVQCYDYLNLPGFAPREIPSTWVAGAESTAVDARVTCQRRATDGADYRGTVNVTREGLPCQYWNTTSPQDHTRLPSRLPEYGLGFSDRDGDNYCRNPDNTPDGVWCYIDKEDSSSQFERWQYCDVKLCEDAPSVLDGADEETSVTSRDDSCRTTDIVLICVCSAVLLLLTVLLFIFRRRLRSSMCSGNKALNTSAPSFSPGSRAKPSQTEPEYVIMTPYQTGAEQ